MSTTLDAWEILQTVAQLGGFAPAAEKLNRSQSTISYAIGRLQDQLGIRLFEIQGRKAQLTEVGMALLADAEPHLSGFHQIEQRAPAVQVRAKYEHYQEYLKRIPALRAKPVPIAIDEWAYFGGGMNSYKTVPAYAWAFHEMFRHSDIFQMGAFTFATAMMSSNRTEATLNPTGMLFKMYRDHFGVIPVEVTGNSPQPKPTFPAGGDQPAVNPGSDTYPLDVSAALSEDRKTLTFAVLNPSDAKQSLTLAINGAKLASQGKLWQMAPSKVDAVVAVGKTPELTVDEHTLGAAPGTIDAPPFSISIYSYPIE
jgi:alpha-N-arabinofuranosidase